MQRAVRYLSPTANWVVIAENPKAGIGSSRATVKRLARRLSLRGLKVEVLSQLDKAQSRVSEMAAEGRLRAVVAAGGDGTVGEIINRTGDGVPIMVLPLGTENLLAKHIGVRPDPGLVCDTILRGATVQIDAGRVGGRIFFMVLSCGFDAEVIRRLHKRRRGNITRFAYAKPILDTIRSYQYPELRVYCDDKPQATSARWVFVNNLPHYGLGLQIVPDAVGHDGLLDVCTFKNGSFWTGLMYLTAVILGQHRSWNDCTTQRTRRLRIESDAPVPYELDGDPGGYLPIEVEILPRRMTLLVPEPWATGQGYSLPSR